MPHMSLLYGNHDKATRERVVGQITLPAEAFIISKLTITPAVMDTSEW
jgi:hypothetical protein